MPDPKPKYRTGDRLLAVVTIEKSAHSDSVFVRTDSNETAQLKESDIHSAILLLFRVGDRVVWREDGTEFAGEVKATAYNIEPPQIWVKPDHQWTMRTFDPTKLARPIY